MQRFAFLPASLLIALFAGSIDRPVYAQVPTLEERLRLLEEQNSRLQREFDRQKETILELQKRAGSTSSSMDEELPKPGGMNLGRVHLSAEGGLAFFHASSDGENQHSSFRVDEAKLFLEAPIWRNTYLFAELDLVIREANDEFFHLGELYLDFENVLRHWTEDNYLSVRVGRFDIPFGEEYLNRDAIDNPLVSHSLSDLWGIDEGIEAYGSALGFDYVLAVQNGGHPALSDWNDDKSVAGRIGYNFGRRARISFSGIRTGELSPDKDKFSELWFGDGFFRSIGNPATTSSFEATVFELDGQLFWKTGHLKLAGGYFEYGDDDSTRSNERDGYYYYLESVQNLTTKLYSAARFSQILAEKGLPIVGLGEFGKYMYGPLTDDIWRLSLGFGYRWSENLIGKLEYTREEGSVTAGSSRRVNAVAAELAFKF
jgi:hypothetical protein